MVNEMSSKSLAKDTVLLISQVMGALDGGETITLAYLGTGDTVK